MARQELAKRQAGRTSLLAFTTYTKPDYRVGPPHRLICDKLERVERGEIKRLMVFAPPRTGKSELTSVRFPAWFLGRNPTKQVITTSYGADLAQKFGRDTRNTLQSRTFANIFPNVRIAADSAAKGAWHTDKGGAYVAVGVGGGLTGHGGHVCLIDDPTRDRQDAESETVRESTWDWYRSVLRTRLMPGGAIVLVMTRWHGSDLGGRLLEDMQQGTGEAWEVVNLPAIAGEGDALGRAPGEALWPESYDLEALGKIRGALGERDWSALYQQDPRPGEGGLFKTAMLGAIDASLGGKQVRRWDLAATARTGTRDPDWTVGVLMTKTPEGRYVIDDVVRLRGGPDEVEATILATAQRDGRAVTIGLPTDPGQAGVAQALYLTRKLAGFVVKTERETGDKATRAAPFASQVNVGNVAVVKAPWNRAFNEELSGFPSMAHDDQVDAAAGAFNMFGTTGEPARFAYIPRVRG